MHVSNISIAIMLFDMILGILVPITLMIVVKKKFKLGLKPFFIGCLGMFLFAFVLEQIVHTVILGSQVGSAIQNNVWLFAVYGGLMAGLFEETGRFLFMKYLLVKEQQNAHNAILYGVGHGGFEMAYLLVFGMLNNLIYSVMLNTGSKMILLAPLDETNRQAVEAGFETLVNTPPYMFLLSPVERAAALVLQIALSMLVWMAVTGLGTKWLFPLAIMIHMLVDTGTVLMSRLGVPIILIELIIWVFAAACSLLVIRMWRNERLRQKPEE